MRRVRWRGNAAWWAPPGIAPRDAGARDERARDVPACKRRGPAGMVIADLLHPTPACQGGIHPHRSTGVSDMNKFRTASVAAAAVMAIGAGLAIAQGTGTAGSTGSPS